MIWDFLPSNSYVKTFPITLFSEENLTCKVLKETFREREIIVTSLILMLVWNEKFRNDQYLAFLVSSLHSKATTIKVYFLLWDDLHD